MGIRGPLAAHYVGCFLSEWVQLRTNGKIANGRREVLALREDCEDLVAEGTLSWRITNLTSHSTYSVLVQYQKADDVEMLVMRKYKFDMGAKGVIDCIAITDLSVASSTK